MKKFEDAVWFGMQRQGKMMAPIPTLHECEILQFCNSQTQELVPVGALFVLPSLG